MSTCPRKRIVFYSDFWSLALRTYIRMSKHLKWKSRRLMMIVPLWVNKQGRFVKKKKKKSIAFSPTPLPCAPNPVLFSLGKYNENFPNQVVSTPALKSEMQSPITLVHPDGNGRDISERDGFSNKGNWNNLFTKWVLCIMIISSHTEFYLLPLSKLHPPLFHNLELNVSNYWD